MVLSLARFSIIFRISFLDFLEILKSRRFQNLLEQLEALNLRDFWQGISDILNRAVLASGTFFCVIYLSLVSARLFDIIDHIYLYEFIDSQNRRADSPREIDQRGGKTGLDAGNT